jgi:hypothetical protein
MGRGVALPVIVMVLVHVHLDLGGAEAALHHLAPLEGVAWQRQAPEPVA